MSLAMHPVGYIVACRVLDRNIRRIPIFGPIVLATSATVVGVAAMIAALRPDTSSAALVAISVMSGVAIYAASLAAISGRQLYAQFRFLRAAS